MKIFGCLMNKFVIVSPNMTKDVWKSKQDEKYRKIVKPGNSLQKMSGIFLNKYTW